MIRSLIKEDVDYIQEGNIFHFLREDASRPAWSRALDDYLTGNHIDLMMKRKYSGQKRRMNSNEALRHFVEYDRKPPADCIMLCISDNIPYRFINFNG